MLVGLFGLSGQSQIFHDLRRSAARNMRRAGVPENTIMKIAGWKTPNMFRRYDIQDGRDIRQIMGSAWLKSAISTISSTMTAQRQNTVAVQEEPQKIELRELEIWLRGGVNHRPLGYEFSEPFLLLHGRSRSSVT